MGRVLVRIWGRVRVRVLVRGFVRGRAWYSFECAYLFPVNGLLILVSAPWKEIGFVGPGYPWGELARNFPVELATPGSVRP
jgi:hypothetical protein